MSDKMPLFENEENERLKQRIRELESENTELRKALGFALEWIDAVPHDTILPTMPGFDRDWVESVYKKEQPR